MGVLDQFLKEAFTGPQLRDQRHANYLFTNNNYELSPKYQFLFFVRITLNPKLTRLPKERQMEIGMLAKSADLPKYTVDVKTFNAYNRPNYVQTKLKYDPINFKFHDDSADVVREFWYDYYSYYYRDSDYQESLYAAPHKYQKRMAQDWGYSPLYGKKLENENQLIQDIQIFSFHQKRFSCYTLHNPIITSFKHGQHDHSQGQGTMENDMTVSYESVTYSKGYVTPNNFGDMTLLYDLMPSPLTPAGGGTQSIFGPGGVLNAADDVVSNLADGNIVGALFTAGRAYQTNKNTNLGAVGLEELKNIGVGILRGTNPASRVAVPGISNLLGGAQNDVSGIFGSVTGNGGIPYPSGSNTTLLAGLSAAAVALIPSGMRNISPTNVASRAITSNGDSVIDNPVSDLSNYNFEFPAIDEGTATYDPFLDPGYSQEDGQEYANINYDFEALPPSNQDYPDDLGDFFG